eukprot:scaffold2226_cov166-Pinguiococcus_pyrenoidosus.AAC.2
MAGPGQDVSGREAGVAPRRRRSRYGHTGRTGPVAAFQPARHLSRGHLRWFDSDGRLVQEAPTVIRERVGPGWSAVVENPVLKTDQLKQKYQQAPVILPWSTAPHNCAEWLLRYEIANPVPDSERRSYPMFSWPRNPTRRVTYEQLLKAIRAAMGVYLRHSPETHERVEHFGTHSFRIGGGVAHAAAGSQDWVRRRTSRRASSSSLPVYERSI